MRIVRPGSAVSSFGSSTGFASAIRHHCSASPRNRKATRSGRSPAATTYRLTVVKLSGGGSSRRRRYGKVRPSGCVYSLVSIPKYRLVRGYDVGGRTASSGLVMEYLRWSESGQSERGKLRRCGRRRQPFLLGQVCQEQLPAAVPGRQVVDGEHPQAEIHRGADRVQVGVERVLGDGEFGDAHRKHPRAAPDPERER